MTVAARTDKLGLDLQRPVVLYDRDLRLLAHSEHSEHTIDANRRGAILSRRTQPRALELVRASGVSRSARPVLIASDPGHADRIGVAVSSAESLLGYLVCTVEPGDLPLCDVHEHLLMEAAAEIGVLLEHHSQADAGRRAREASVLSRLLEAPAPTEEAALAALAEVGCAPPRTGYLMGFGSGNISDTLLGLPGRQLSTHPEGSTAAVFLCDGTPERVVDLISRRLDPQASHRANGTESGANMGFSSLHRSPATLAAAADEARLAWTATQRDPLSYPRIAQWDHLGADRLLLRLPLDALTAHDLPAPVKALLAASTGADLALTVEAYLDHGGDAQATARALSIHRSTLYYRLDRVSTLTGVDPREGATRADFQIGLRVATLAGLRPAPDHA